MASDSILRVCAYHRRDFDLVIIRSRPHEIRKVQKSLSTPFKTPPTSGLAVLDRLPAELMSIILNNLDVLSLFRFRQVNRWARILSTALREYRLVAMHGLEGLRGLIRARIAQNFTIGGLYNSLTTSNCALCGEFGGFLFLLTLSRCCFACITTSPDLRVIPITTFSKLAKTPTAKLQLLVPTLRTVPGLYSMEERTFKRPKFVIAEKDAIATLQSRNALSQTSLQALRTRNEQANQRFMVSTAFPSYDLKSGKIDRGVSCKGCQVRVENSSQEYEDRDFVFSRLGFLSHFEDCAEAQLLWAQSEGGTLSIREPEFTRQCGYFNRLHSDGLPR